MYFEGLEAIPLIFSGCHEHNISEYKKALSWAQRNGYKSDIENLKREIEEEQTEMSNKNCELEFEIEKLQTENEELKEIDEKNSLKGK